MAPSVHPEDYSKVCILDHLSHRLIAYWCKWCSWCGGFGQVLVLCTGCRVGMCVKNTQTLLGCVEWMPELDGEDFVFCCPFCAREKGIQCNVCGLVSRPLRCFILYLLQLRLCDQESKRDKIEVLFRYDPPVILVGCTWHETRVRFLDSLYQHLAMSYNHHQEYVCIPTIVAVRPLTVPVDYGR